MFKSVRFLSTCKTVSFFQDREIKLTANLIHHGFIRQLDTKKMNALQILHISPVQFIIPEKFQNAPLLPQLGPTSFPGFSSNTNPKLPVIIAFLNSSSLTRLHHTGRFFVVELQIFCRGQIGLNFVGTSACRTLANFLLRLTAFKVGAESISAMLEKTLVHVTLMRIPHRLRHTRAPKNCLGPPHTNRQDATRRIAI